MCQRMRPPPSADASAPSEQHHNSQHTKGNLVIDFRETRVLKILCLIIHRPRIWPASRGHAEYIRTESIDGWALRSCRMQIERVGIDAEIKSMQLRKPSVYLIERRYFLDSYVRGILHVKSSYAVTRGAARAQ